MPGKLILKLMFKATVPLVAVTGVLSYGFYLQGGDPKALLGKVASGMGDQVGRQIAGAGDSARGALHAAGNLGVLGGSAPGDGIGTDEPSHETRVHRWVDAEGLTHYSTEAPAPGQQGTIVTVSSRTNVVAAVPPRDWRESSVSTRAWPDSGADEQGIRADPVDSTRQSSGRSRSNQAGARRTSGSPGPEDVGEFADGRTPAQQSLADTLEQVNKVLPTGLMQRYTAQ